MNEGNLMNLLSRGGHRHLQIGRMLDIDLISEPPPPTPPPPRCMYPKCGNLCGQRGRKRFIDSWVLRMSHICPCTPCPSPLSKVVILSTTANEGCDLRPGWGRRIWGNYIFRKWPKRWPQFLFDSIHWAKQIGRRSIAAMWVTHISLRLFRTSENLKLIY